MAVRVASSLTTVRFEATSTGNGAPAPENRNSPWPARPVLSISKPSWVVRTESNVRRERVKMPDPPCVICKGSGRLDCRSCNGRGRTNHIQSTMLPKGEWPKWCRSCGGSGLEYCDRCLGTGEYRSQIGFHFRNKDADDVQDTGRYRDRHDRRISFRELFSNEGQSESGSET